MNKYGRKKLTQEEVSNRLLSSKITLLEPYKKAHLKHNLRCFCGSEFRCDLTKIFNKNTKSCGCLKISTAQINGAITKSKKSDIDRLCNRLKIKLLDGPYINANHKHKFLCLVHKEGYSTTISHLKRGASIWCCYIAKKKSIFGKNHWKYNHKLTDRQRLELYDRLVIPGYQTWMRKIKSIGFCEICSSKERLVAHHYVTSYKESSIKQKTDIKNGKCLCVNCHTLFHKKYGKTGFDTNDWFKFESEMRSNQ